MSAKNETEMVRTNSVGWMIQRIARHLDREMSARLAEHDLSILQFAIMMTVLETDGLTQASIGAQYSAPAYAISRAIDHLEGLGLLERRRHPKSRRSHTIHATEKGQSLAPALYTIVREVNTELTAPLGKWDKARFQDLLTRLLPQASR